MAESLDAKSFFEQEISLKAAMLKTLKTQLVWVSLSRLFAFLAAFLPFFVLSAPVYVSTIICIAFLAGFLVLVSRHTDLSTKKRRLEFYLKICRQELAALDGNYRPFGNGKSYANPGHPFAHDLDIFGERSFFQTLNRTSFSESEAYLASLILENGISNVPQKQEVIQEFAERMTWCLDFRSTAELDKQLEQERIKRALVDHQPGFPKWLPLLSYVFTGVSFLGVVAIFAFDLSWEILLIPYFTGLLITAAYLRKINALHARTGGLSLAFRQISGLNVLLEREDWKHPQIREKLMTGEEKSREPYSELFAKFSRLASAFDQRGNFLFALFSNGFFLWDLRYAALVDQWIVRYGRSGAAVYDTVNWFDAQISLATYAFTHPSFTYPQFSNDQVSLIRAQKLSHPMIRKERRIANDWSLERSGFQVITGANMAGKSTFLRSVGLSLVMANTGLPVCASSYEYRPVKLVSSMRSSDSLGDDASYFFAELSRLREIIDLIGQEPYLIVLDEILKGTNSKDKEEGSRKFLERLLHTGSSGLIATHDLSLCELEKKHSQIHNYYFEAEILKDQLHFDYRLKTGICQNMNASFLLKKMGITD